MPVPPDLRLLVTAALPHVAFDGWSVATVDAAAQDVGMTLENARTLVPRGGVDLAVACHRMGDDAMLRQLSATDQSGMRFRERVALALRLRVAAIPDRESLRRATALFALPHLAPTGAGLIWGTADAVWTALGDTSVDGNWYTKRATLAAVWTAVVLYWLGDDSPDGAATQDFIDRRIDEVMRFEGAKARLAATPALRAVSAPLSWLMTTLRAPTARDDLPGRWTAGAPDV